MGRRGSLTIHGYSAGRGQSWGSESGRLDPEPTLVSIYCLLGGGESSGPPSQEGTHADTPISELPKPVPGAQAGEGVLLHQ